MASPKKMTAFCGRAYGVAGMVGRRTWNAPRSMLHSPRYRGLKRASASRGISRRIRGASRVLCTAPPLSRPVYIKVSNDFRAMASRVSTSGRFGRVFNIGRSAFAPCRCARMLHSLSRMFCCLGTAHPILFAVPRAPPSCARRARSSADNRHICRLAALPRTSAAFCPIARQAQTRHGADSMDAWMTRHHQQQHIGVSVAYLAEHGHCVCVSLNATCMRAPFAAPRSLCCCRAALAALHSLRFRRSRAPPLSHRTIAAAPPPAAPLPAAPLPLRAQHSVAYTRLTPPFQNGEQLRVRRRKTGRRDGMFSWISK